LGDLFDVHRNKAKRLEFSRGRPGPKDGPRDGIFVTCWWLIKRILSWRNRCYPAMDATQDDLAADEKIQ
jgi:hypothetical protein